MAGGITHANADELVKSIEGARIDEERLQVIDEELEAARDRQEEVKAQITRCQTLLEGSRQWVRFDAGAFRQALSCSLGLLGADPLRQTTDAHGNEVWEFPRLDRRGDHIDTRLDRAAGRAERNGRVLAAERLDGRGDRVDRRLDRRGETIDRTLDRRGRQVDRRMDRRATHRV